MKDIKIWKDLGKTNISKDEEAFGHHILINIFFVTLNVFSKISKNARFIFSPEMGQKINFMGLIMKFQFLHQGATMNFFYCPTQSSYMKILFS